MANSGNGLLETAAGNSFSLFSSSFIAQQEIRLHVSQLLSLQNPSSLYPVSHHEIINFSLRALGIGDACSYKDTFITSKIYFLQ